MNKAIKLFTTAIALAVIALAPVCVGAASTPRILSLNASQSGGTISVDGTAEVNMLAASISIYDSAGTNLLALETAQVDNGAFSHSLAIEEGNYKVCAANYDPGEQFCVDLVTETATSDDTAAATTAGSPETGYAQTSDDSAATTDNTWMIIAAAAVAVIGAVAIVLIRRHAYAKAEQ